MSAIPLPAHTRRVNAEREAAPDRRQRRRPPLIRNFFIAAVRFQLALSEQPSRRWFAEFFRKFLSLPCRLRAYSFVLEITEMLVACCTPSFAITTKTRRVPGPANRTLRS